jgi:hypothetical protein
MDGIPQEHVNATALKRFSLHFTCVCVCIYFFQFNGGIMQVKFIRKTIMSEMVWLKIESRAKF